MRHNIIVGSLLALLALVLDQWSKYAAFAFLEGRGTHSYTITSFFNLVEVYNPGISFGLLHGIPYGQVVISVFAMLVVTALCIWLVMADHVRLVIGLGMIIGGAVGNVIDRVLYGAVKDFLDFHVNNWHWPAFNIADSAVCLGVLLVIIDGLYEKKAGKVRKK